jgi:thymidylate kinase
MVHAKQRLIPYHGVVILDGPDATGKTTLAKELLKIAGPKYSKYYHLSYKYPDNMFLYQLAALHLADKWSHFGIVVIDRQWMSEGVYASVYRGGSKWPHMGRMMDRAFRGMGTVNVVCIPENIDDHNILFNKMKNTRYEMYDNQRNVAKRFLDFWDGNKDSTGNDYVSQLTRLGGVKDRDDFLRYCFPENIANKATVNDFALLTLDKVDARWQSQPAFVTKRGQPQNGETNGYNHNFGGFLDTAEWLIVGDMCNPKYRAIRYPFLDYSHSSLFLSTCLHEIGFDETRAIYINVNDHYGAIGITEALKKKPNLRILCLGNEALDGVKTRCQGYLQSLAVYPEIYKTCHPSYAMRFNQKEMLIRDLSNLLGVRHDELKFSIPTN